MLRFRIFSLMALCLLVFVVVTSGLTQEAPQTPPLLPSVQVKGPGNGVGGMKFSPSGKMLAFISGDTVGDEIGLWDVQAEKEIATLSGHVDEVTGITFSPSGKMLASGSLDGTIRFWDVEQGECITVLPNVNRRGNTMEDMVFSPDGKILASSSGNEEIILWDSDKKERIFTIPHDIWDGYSIAFMDSRTFAFIHNEGVALWDIEKQTTVNLIPVDAESFSASPDGHMLAVELGEGAPIQLWDVSGGQHLMSLESNVKWGMFTFSPNSRLLAISGINVENESVIQLWDVKTGQKVFTFTADIGFILTSGFAFSPDGGIAIPNAMDGSITVWDVSSLTEPSEPGKAVEPKDKLTTTWGAVKSEE